MKRLLACLTCLVLTASLCAQVEIQRVWPGYRTADSFTSLREYWGGEPSPATQRALRSQADQRDGYYWLLRTDSAEPLTGVTVRLKVTRAGDTTSERHEFTTDLPADSHALHVGLTGSDWSGQDEVPIAWRLTLLDSAGQTLATTQSYLWSDAGS
jgi:hypothetical protein